MTTIQKIFLFIVLPFLSPLLLPPDLYTTDRGPILILPLLIAVTSLLMGPFLWRGQSTALTLVIFMQGLNVIIRLMMFFPNVIVRGEFNPLWMLTSLISMGLSMYLVLRLDRTDVRVTMVG